MTRTYEFIGGDDGVSKQAPIKAWIKGVPMDENTFHQVRKTAQMPFVLGVALMPDAHVGIGSTVGSVIATQQALIPAAVGVDIGCGMVASKTSLTANDLPDSLSIMRSVIEGHVPHGFTKGGRDKGSWGEPPELVTEAMLDGDTCLQEGLSTIVSKHPKIVKAAGRAPSQLGTLGTGNHFIELCLDEQGSVWVLLHSGSRGIGNAIGSYFIELAREDMRRYWINLPDRDLAYLPEGTEHHDDYVEAVLWAQRYAAKNREIMLRQVLLAMRKVLGREFEAGVVAVNCHHNYVAKENHLGQNVWITRKGAVRARKDDLGIIPGSMGARSYIVRGLGNDESFHSCSHGAGRVMSRTEARKQITLEQHVAATEGIECRRDEAVLDESPAAYKPIDAVMSAQADLVEVVYELRQILNVKG